MATHNSVHVSDELLAELRANAAAEGKTVDQLAEEALRRHLAQQTLDRLRLDADRRRQGMTDHGVDDVVERAVNEMRGL